jgi:two-component system, NtrC family, sensor histidine kinase HydH
VRVRRSLTGAFAPLAAAAVVCAVLLAAARVIVRGVEDASELVTRGLAEAFVVAGWQALGHEPLPPTAESLQQFLEEHADDGLRYVAVVGADGRVMHSAGTALAELTGEGLTISGTRARMVRRLRPGGPGPWRRMMGPDAGRDAFRMRALRVVYEFEPLAALALQRRAKHLLWVALASCLAVLGLAVALSRSLRRGEALQGELEQGRRLAALGSMSAVLAHELRNPLASLKGHAQLLAESTEHQPALAPKAERVVQEAVRLEHLLDDLLTFVRKGELDLAPTDPNEVLRAAIEACEPSRIDAHFLPHPTRLALDPARLRQALENVLRNALEASPPTARITAVLELADGQLRATVRDHGPGIPSGDEARIFEPFVTGKVRGVGLGLAITRRIAELHGGTAFARTHPEGGAELRLTLPAKEA